MSNTPEDKSISQALAGADDVIKLREVAGAAVRRARGLFEQARTTNASAEEKQTRALEVDDAPLDERAQLERIREDLNDKTNTHRTLESQAKRVRREAELARRAAAKAEAIAKTDGARTLSAEVKRLADEGQAVAEEATLLADKAKLAAEAAESIGKLAVYGFVKEQQPLIFERLEECDAIAKEAGGTTLFVAQSLPVVNGIIYVGSSQDNLNQAIDWVKSRWGRADAQIVLSALVFRYIADLGLAYYQHESRQGLRYDRTGELKIEIWQRITERVEKLRI